MKKAPVSNGGSLRAEISISSDDWTRIERAWGAPLSDDARSRIKAATLNFIGLVIHQQQAYPTAFTRQLLDEIHSATLKLSRLISLSNPPAGMEDVRNLLTNSIDDPRLGCIGKDARLPHHLSRFSLRDPYVEFVSVLESFRLATYNAIDQVDEPGRALDSSDAWNIWIEHLHAVLANNQKGHGHLASFVRLVEALEPRIPDFAQRKFTNPNGQDRRTAIERALGIRPQKAKHPK